MRQNISCFLSNLPCAAVQPSWSPPSCQSRATSSAGKGALMAALAYVVLLLLAGISEAQGESVDLARLVWVSSMKRKLLIWQSNSVVSHSTADTECMHGWKFKGLPCLPVCISMCLCNFHQTQFYMCSTAGLNLADRTWRACHLQYMRVSFAFLKINMPTATLFYQIEWNCLHGVAAPAWS